MGLFSFLFGTRSQELTPAGLTAKPASRFRAGQVWAFHTPPHQPNARLTILHVENRRQIGTIVHIALSGLVLPHGQSTAKHMPFAEEAIEKSVTTLIEESGPVPDFHEGYEQWQRANGGVFTISVGEGIEAILFAYRQIESGEAKPVQGSTRPHNAPPA